MSGDRPPDSDISDMSDITDESMSEDEQGITSTPDNPIPTVTYGDVLGREFGKTKDKYIKLKLKVFLFDSLILYVMLKGDSIK